MSTKRESPPASPLDHLKTFLGDHPAVIHICLNITDYAGVQRTRLMSTRQALNVASNPSHPSAASSGGPLNWAITRTQNLNANALEIGQTDHWIPDWSSIRLSAKDEKGAMAEVHCWVRESKPWTERENGWISVDSSMDDDESDTKKDDGLSGDPRTMLEKLESKVKDEHGIDFLVGYEIEFILSANVHAEQSIDTSDVMYSTDAMRVKSARVILDAAEHLEANGIACWNYHCECAAGITGKYELSLAPLPPSKASDALLYSINVLQDMANRHGYFATVHPHPFEIGPTAGQHIHFSLSKVESADHFLAGIMARMEQLMAFFLSGYDSYSDARGHMYGQGFIYWSYDKMAPAKEVAPGHWEFRMPDTFCHPALQLVAMISAGLEGIKDKKELMEPAHGLEVARMTEEQRKELGIRTGPRSLEAAIDALEGEKEWWSEHLSESCIQGILNNRRAEVEISKKMTYRQRTHAIHYGH